LGHGGLEAGAVWMVRAGASRGEPSWASFARQDQAGGGGRQQALCPASAPGHHRRPGRNPGSRSAAASAHGQVPHLQVIAKPQGLDRCRLSTNLAAGRSGRAASAISQPGTGNNPSRLNRVTGGAAMVRGERCYGEALWRVVGPALSRVQRAQSGTVAAAGGGRMAAQQAAQGVSQPPRQGPWRLDSPRSHRRCSGG